MIVAAAARTRRRSSSPPELARDRAVVAVVGDVGLDVPRGPFYEKELQLRLSRSYGPGRYDPAYEIEGHDYPIGYVRWTERRLIAYLFEEVAAGRVRLEPLVTHEFALERGVEAYAALEEPGRMAILLRYPAAAALPPGRRGGRVAAAAEAPSWRRARSGSSAPGCSPARRCCRCSREADVRLVAVAGATAPRAFGVGAPRGPAGCPRRPRPRCSTTPTSTRS